MKKMSDYEEAVRKLYWKRIDAHPKGALISALLSGVPTGGMEEEMREEVSDFKRDLDRDIYELLGRRDE